MHRAPLLAMLDRYQALHPTEAPCVERIRRLVSAHSHCFERLCLPGHVTASAWIVSHDHEQFLLTHHRKLDRWLQLGGHADGDGRVEAVALREAREESGMEEFELVASEGVEALVPLDVDVHEIPGYEAEPVHEHHDIRFLLVAGPGQPLRVSDESHDLRWHPVASLERTVLEPSVLRLAHKARELLISRV